MAETQQDQNIQALIDRADAVVRNAQRAIEDSDERLRRLGLDPAKVRQVLAAQPVSEQVRADAEKLYRQDMEDIEREVEQEAAHARHRTEPRASTGAKRPRAMV
ncbi:hypothetical protein CEG14_19750 [Bordetella genomosp. 1]|uniref:Uncharacterized protein n=1 Tax=Bordetella genomosp. 1 TaxID=1395607 RepID=A0A261S7W2_9BORD|nr:hypothetical protein [Bordetella genomosp. 1]MDQ8033437.1 hypothetical protein [Bordetella sp.]OZI33087.1 hypothetical protein CEG14_19750 [Bordetella genomosp. 1]OZI57192.1 hypothetical protein CAL27_23410 [Bordetella genomosp. 1]